MIPAEIGRAAAPVIVAALLSLIGEGKAAFTSREVWTPSGPLRITIALKIERREKTIEWSGQSS